jgi:hypothetical protein
MPRHTSTSLSSVAIGGIVAGGLLAVSLLLTFFLLKCRRAAKNSADRHHDAEFVVGTTLPVETRETVEGHFVLSVPDPANSFVQATQTHAFSKLAREQALADLNQADAAPPSDANDPRATLDLLQNRLREIAGLIAEQEAQTGILPDRGAQSETEILTDGDMREALPAYDARGFVSTDLPPK